MCTRDVPVPLTWGWGHQQDKEHLEVSKDSERMDELKGMVQAWEAEQPGRTKKVRMCGGRGSMGNR